MQVKLKKLHDQTLVITGASSGIGLATAQAAARRGARVVLSSRNAEALGEIEQQIRSAGGQVMQVVADVTRREDLERVADTARQHFGGFDTWVNNAGLSIFGPLQEVNEEDHRQLFEINFWGVVHGSLVAVRHLTHHGGALINVGSVVSDMAIPIQGMYSATKHAVKGFTDALRMELEAENAPVSVTLIKPHSIDTPFTRHARNYMPQEPKLPAPVYRPEEVAHAILQAAVRPIRDVYVGGGGRLFTALRSVAPGMVDRYAARTMPKQQQRDEPARAPEGTLWAAGADGDVHGDQPGYVMKTSLYTRAVLHPVMAGVAVAGAGLAAAWLLRGGDETDGC
jgi:short-subunit dehydrogenase